MTPEAQWFAQLSCAAVCGWALDKLTVELARGGVAAVARRHRTRRAA